MISSILAISAFAENGPRGETRQAISLKYSISARAETDLNPETVPKLSIRPSEIPQ
jgi:hypothetical protein